MSIYCGASFGGGQGYTDTCGQEEYGKGTPIAQCKQCMRQEIYQLKAENESLRADAERYRWLRDAKGLSLRSDGSKWTRSNGDQFICSHHLCAFDTSYAPFESLDEVVDAAISYPENPS